MAYITNYNASRILRQSDLKGVKMDKRGIFRKSIYFFNWYEELFLKIYQEMLEFPEEYFSKLYRKISKPVDDFYYVIPPKSPAYHESLDCPFLLSDYRNFEVPVEIKNQGTEKIIEFRQWFLEVQSLFERDPAAFQARLQLKWKILIPLNEIEKQNSGFADVKNYTLEDLVNKINELLGQARAFMKSSVPNTIILKRYQKQAYFGLRPDPLENNNTGFSDDEVKKVLAIFDTEYKKPIKNLLLEYYRVTFNPKLKFQGTLLEELGFIACSSCAGKSVSV